jgi:hypothetical protein
MGILCLYIVHMSFTDMDVVWESYFLRLSFELAFYIDRWLIRCYLMVQEAPQSSYLYYFHASASALFCLGVCGYRLYILILLSRNIYDIVGV